MLVLVSFLTMAPRLAILFLVEQGMQQKGEEGWGRWWGWWYMEMEVVVVECPLRRAPWSAVLVQNAPWWSQFFQTAFFSFLSFIPCFLGNVFQHTTGTLLIVLQLFYGSSCSSSKSQHCLEKPPKTTCKIFHLVHMQFWRSSGAYLP